MSSENTDFSDPKQGGDLAAMAATGTTVPNDAGAYDVLPSVPRPGQDTDDSALGSASLADAAANQSDVPRSVGDQPAGADVVTGTGDTLPASVDSKRLHDTSNNPAAKGHPRDDKASKQKGADQELGAVDQADAEE